jgi:hypothetical protein
VKRLWPFPGDSPVARARKVALAYRSVALQQHQALASLRDALDKADKRLLAYDSPATLVAIKQALADIGDTDPVAELDKRFTDWGETFHSEQPIHYEMDDYVNATIAGQLIHLNRKSINELRQKGRLKGHWTPDLGPVGGYIYRVSDVYELSSKKRRRTSADKGSADTLNTDGRSDAE